MIDGLVTFQIGPELVEHIACPGAVAQPGVGLGDAMLVIDPKAIDWCILGTRVIRGSADGVGVCGACGRWILGSCRDLTLLGLAVQYSKEN